MSISVLWAKKSKEGNYWLPLDVHLTDTAEVAKRLWRRWVPENVKQTIAVSIGADIQEAERFFIFLAVAHDIGKATPVFQATRSFRTFDLDEYIFNELLKNGFNVKERREDYSSYSQTPHALASQLLLENAQDLGISDTNLCKSAAVILGSHHGKSPDFGYENVLGAYKSNFGCGVETWIQAQRELVQLALEYGGYKSFAKVPCPTMVGQVLLAGLLIIADWIASDESKFPLLPIDYPLKSNPTERVQFGWKKLDLPYKWEPYNIRCDEGLYTDRFDHINKPNSVQIAALQAARNLDKPGIMVIEAPMGLGKTEAALVVAEIFRDKTDSGGVFFALPTQATSDGIFPRLVKWMDNLLDEKHTVKLVHGKAQFNDEYIKLFEGKAEICDEKGEVNDDGETHMSFVHQWFNGRKKAMLADFIVGTIDQLLLMALKQKHVMLRHLGLAGKVVIIDECHAYDAYMSQYLKMAFEWLGAYGVPVIVLSATLPADTRREVIGAYLGDKKIDGEWAKTYAYPLITYTDSRDVKCCVVEPEGDGRAVNVERLAREAVADKLEVLLSDGGCAGIIMDTVQRAQDMAHQLRQCFGVDIVRLIHSRFVTTDRLAKEKELRETLGNNGQRPQKRIVVGTQVLEQSLDIDFDVMFTDIAPMDLLLQRMGRLHRHERSRPEKLRKPICYVTGIDGDGFEKGIDSVYAKHLLIRTKYLLDSHSIISLPGDITPLVNNVYDKNVESTKEKENWEKAIKEKEDKAKTFRIGKPMKKPHKTIVNWLYTDVADDVSGKRGSAAVRDSYDSVEVLVIKEFGGEFFMVNGTHLPKAKLDNALAKQLACQGVTLPRLLSHRGTIQGTIEALESITRDNFSFWHDSPWISGELFLILDNDNTSTLCGHRLTYTSHDGLHIVGD